MEEEEEVPYSMTMTYSMTMGERWDRTEGETFKLDLG